MTARRDPEQKFWDEIRAGMVGRWHAQRHEDKYSTGIPDVSYGIGRRAEGWIELKHLPALPAFNDAPWDFNWRHFTAEQRNWMSERVKHGTGRVFLACRFGPALAAVWSWKRLAPMLGHKPADQIIRAASGQWWHGPIDHGELAEILTNNRIIEPRYKI